MGYFERFMCNCPAGCYACGHGKRKRYVCTLYCQECKRCLDDRLLRQQYCECDFDDICRCKDPYYILWSSDVTDALDPKTRKDPYQELIHCAVRSGDKTGFWIIPKVPKELKDRFIEILKEELKYTPEFIISHFDFGWKHPFYMNKPDIGFVPFRIWMPDFADVDNTIRVVNLTARFMEEAAIPPQTIYLKPAFFTRLRDLKNSIIKGNYLIRCEITTKYEAKAY